MESVRDILLILGGERMGQKDLAEEALWATGAQSVNLSWAEFIRLLEEMGRLEDAFNAGVKQTPTGRWRSQVPTWQDSYDIWQETLIAAWKNFKQFRPTRVGSFDAWLIVIAKNKLNDFLRNHYLRNEYHVLLPEITMAERTVIRDERGWSIPIICQEWIQKGGKKGKFAEQILLVYYGSEIALPNTVKGTSEWAKLIDVSGFEISLWWNQFIVEVWEMEKEVHDAVVKTS